jgi:hypothetical protein
VKAINTRGHSFFYWMKNNSPFLQRFLLLMLFLFHTSSISISISISAIFSYSQNNNTIAFWIWSILKDIKKKKKGFCFFFGEAEDATWILVRARPRWFWCWVRRDWPLWSSWSGLYLCFFFPHVIWDFDWSFHFWLLLIKVELAHVRNKWYCCNVSFSAQCYVILLVTLAFWLMDSFIVFLAV